MNGTKPAVQEGDRRRGRIWEFMQIKGEMGARW